MKPLAEYVNQEITLAWARKTSFETRAFSVVTMNVALATLFVALQGQLKFASVNLELDIKTALFIALGSSILSVASAAAAALPFNYPIPEIQSFKDVFAEAKASKDPTAEILETRIKQLDFTIKSNSKKAFFTVGSFIFLGVTASGLIASTILYYV